MFVWFWVGIDKRSGETIIFNVIFSSDFTIVSFFRECTVWFSTFVFPCEWWNFNFLHRDGLKPSITLHLTWNSNVKNGKCFVVVINVVARLISLVSIFCYLILCSGGSCIVIWLNFFLSILLHLQEKWLYYWYLQSSSSQSIWTSVFLCQTI